MCSVHAEVEKGAADYQVLNLFMWIGYIHGDVLRLQIHCASAMATFRLKFPRYHLLAYPQSIPRILYLDKTHVSCEFHCEIIDQYVFVGT